MATVKQAEINGIIDTSRPTIDNINMLATASGAYFTHDLQAGKWTFNIIKPSYTSVKNFSDSNIIGPISVHSKGISEFYNVCSIEFPHKDLRDAVDTVIVKKPTSEWFTYEKRNELKIQMPIINDPVQAQYIAAKELNQSRLDKVIRFTSDFTANGITAGDIIDVTSSMHQFSGKPFIVIEIEESDEEGALLYNITALEYLSTVYSPTGLEREYRTKQNGIRSRCSNNEIEDSDTEAVRNRLPNAKVLEETDCYTPQLSIRNITISGPSSACEGETITLNFGVPSDVDTSTANFTKPYTITGVQQADITIPLTGEITFTNGTGSIDIGIDASADTEGEETLVFTVCGVSHSVTIKDQYLTTPVYNLTASASSLTECDSVTFTLSATNHNNGDDIAYTITGIDSSDLLTGSLTGNFTADWCDEDGSLTFTFTKGSLEGNETLQLALNNGGASQSVTLSDDYDYSISFSPSSIVEGASSTATITITGGIPDGNYPYTISGGGTGRLSSPALSGTVAISGGSGTLVLQTVDDDEENGSQSVTLTVGPASGKSCSGSAILFITDNDGVGAGDFICDYVQVPVVWCGLFDGTSQYMKNVSVRKYAYLPRAPVGGTAVPLTVSVSNPGTASAALSIDTTVNIDPVTGAGGAQIDVITSFDPLPTGGDTLITGTTSTFNGYW